MMSGKNFWSEMSSQAWELEAEGPASTDEGDTGEDTAAALSRGRGGSDQE